MARGALPAPSDFALRAVGIIRDRLAEVGMEQQQLAVTLDLSSSQVSRILRGERVITVDQLAAASHALGLSLRDVIAEAEGASEAAPTVTDAADLATVHTIGRVTTNVEKRAALKGGRKADEPHAD